MEIYGINFEHKHKNQEKPARRGAEQYRDSHRRPGVVGMELDQELPGVGTQWTRKALKLSPRRRNPGKARSRGSWSSWAITTSMYWHSCAHYSYTLVVQISYWHITYNYKLLNVFLIQFLSSRSLNPPQRLLTGEHGIIRNNKKVCRLTVKNLVGC